jgi:hypothetical protein
VNCSFGITNDFPIESKAREMDARECNASCAQFSQAGRAENAKDCGRLNVRWDIQTTEVNRASEKKGSLSLSRIHEPHLR